MQRLYVGVGCNGHVPLARTHQWQCLIVPSCENLGDSLLKVVSEDNKVTNKDIAVTSILFDITTPNRRISKFPFLCMGGFID